MPICVAIILIDKYLLLRASYFLDDNSVYNNEAVGLGGLGFPDRNKIFKGAFVNAGDPAWFETLKTMYALATRRHMQKHTQDKHI